VKVWYQYPYEELELWIWFLEVGSKEAEIVVGIQTSWVWSEASWIKSEIDLFKKENQYSCLLLSGYSVTIDFDESAVKASFDRKKRIKCSWSDALLIVFAVLYLSKLSFKYWKLSVLRKILSRLVWRKWSAVKFSRKKFLEKMFHVKLTPYW